MNAIGEVRWEKLGAWERPAWEALGWDEERFNAERGPPDVAWEDLSEKQRKAAAMLGCDMQGWAEAVQEEKEAKVQRAKDAVLGTSQDREKESEAAIDKFMAELTKATEAEAAVQASQAKQRAAAARVQAMHERALARVAEARSMVDDKFTSWLEQVEAERGRIQKRDLDWTRIETLLQPDVFLGVAERPEMVSPR